MTNATAISKAALSISTNILIVGGSFAGIGAVTALRNAFKESPPATKVSITVVEPRGGFLNLLGIPRTIVDPEFAKTQYVSLDGYKSLFFDRLVSDDEYVLKLAADKIQPGVNLGVEITYVQGKVTKLGRTSAEYALINKTGGKSNINFDYCIIAAGRNRTWPSSPDAINYESYLKEMIEFNAQVKKSNKIAVIGAGGVGIEIAGDIKSHHPDKEVILIHPHETFPPEKLTDEFKKEVRKSLERANVKILTGKRVKRELENKNLELTTGEIIEADFTYWCTLFKNNTDILLEGLEKFISSKNNILVNEYFQLYNPETKELVENIFSAGDMVEIPIIKTAGYAISMGRHVGENLKSKINDGKLEKPYPLELSNAMLLVCGNNDIVSDVMGKVEVNNKDYVDMYKSYRFDRVRLTLGI